MYHVEYTKAGEDVYPPIRCSFDAAGWDLHAWTYENHQTSENDDWMVMIPPWSTIKIRTGICMSIPKGCFGGIYARSGLATKKGLAPANKVGKLLNF